MFGLFALSFNLSFRHNPKRNNYFVTGKLFPAASGVFPLSGKTLKGCPRAQKDREQLKQGVKGWGKSGP